MMKLDGHDGLTATSMINPKAVAVLSVAGGLQSGVSWLGISDALMFCEAIRRMNQRPSAGHLWRARQDARKLLKRHQHPIRVLARALEHAGCLTEVEILAIVCRASPRLRASLSKIDAPGSPFRMIRHLFSVCIAAQDLPDGALSALLEREALHYWFGPEKSPICNLPAWFARAERPDGLARRGTSDAGIFVASLWQCEACAAVVAAINLMAEHGEHVPLDVFKDAMCALHEVLQRLRALKLHSVQPFAVTPPAPPPAHVKESTT